MTPIKEMIFTFILLMLLTLSAIFLVLDAINMSLCWQSIIIIIGIFTILNAAWTCEIWRNKL